ncbi:MAG: response regulator [Cyanobacteria bacterium P01_G01_bin.38]
MTTPQSSPQSHPSAQVSTGLPKSWLHRLKVGQKIGLGYATALGIAVVGTITGIVIGNAHQHHALEIQEDAIGEILELKDLEAALIRLNVNERDLVTWLDSPDQFQATYQTYQGNVLAFQDAWAELLEEYEEDSAEGIEREEELEFLENLVETYDGVLENYLEEVDRFLEDLSLNELQGSRLTEARQTLIEINRRPASLQVREFSEALSELVDSIEAIELEEAEEAVQTAARLRIRVIGLSIALSLIVASLLAWLISRAINHPLKAVEETALQVTRDKNFNLRAAVVSGDEVGTLATTLNQLIEWVGTHTHALTLAQQDLEEQTQELNAIIDNLGDGLLVIDPKGCITRSNPALRKLFSLNDTALGGQSVEGIFEQRITDLVTQNQTAPETSLSAELALPENRVGQALVTAIIPDAATVVESDQVQSAGSVVLIRDITAEKEVDQMKTDFISTVSHELRTPLTSVLGFAKLIQKKLEDTVLPTVKAENRKTERAVRQVRENLNIIVSEGERLTSLINDVLDIAKIEAGKIEWNMQPIAISNIIERAIAATSVLAQNSGLEITCDIDPDLPEIIGDRDRLIQVVINLLSNAIKFTDQGTVICRAQRQASDITISVIDTGVGLATDDLEKVFEKFKQVGEVMTDKPKGTGLGLPICKQIIEHHGGRIWAESTLGEGSTFSFTLPLSVSVEAEVAKLNLQTLVQQLKENVDRAVTSEDKTQKSILVVDDEPHIRKLLRQELESAGYQVQEAKDGMDALRQVKVTPPDLIIMDVMMPNINGFDLAAVLKNNPATMEIPTIVLSIIQDQERGYRLGVDRYLSKPIDTDALLRDIKTLLAQGTSNRKVLVVDMDTSTTNTLTEILLSKGYSVSEATTGQEGIEKALSLKPDMIIVDSAISTEHNLVKTLRFDNGLENIFFIMLKGSEPVQIPPEPPSLTGASV